MSNFSRGTNRQPEITTLFGSPKIADETQPSPPDERFAITRKSLGKTLVVLAAIPFLWGAYVGAYRYWHPAPTLWTRTDANVLDGRIQNTRDLCPPGWHSGTVGHLVPHCDYYIFRFGVSYFVGGESRQSKLDSPLFTQKREAEAWASQFEPGRQLTIIYDPLDARRIRRADDPPPGQYAAGPSIRYYPLGMGGPDVTVESAAVPMKAALCLLLPGILLILSSRSEQHSL
ncbi:MAG TPA: hypothetical protein VNU74_07695 [Terriglobales bacterium]|jgi:hypothetical protein|nr:hypothetical protein [Terriglobales bacterium]